MEEKKYLYSVRPRRPIKTLKDVKVIRTPQTLYLTADEVRECLKCGTVYRRFKVDQNVQVAGRDIERLHNDTFMTEKEYAKFLADGKGKDRGTHEHVDPAVDSKGVKVDGNTEQGGSTSTQIKNETPERSSEDNIEAEKVDTETSGSNSDQVEAVEKKEERRDETDGTETDANDQASNSELTTVENDSVSNTNESENETDADAAQVQVDQDADTKQNFQASPIQVNTTYKNNKKRKK